MLSILELKQTKLKADKSFVGVKTFYLLVILK